MGDTIKMIPPICKISNDYKTRRGNYLLRIEPASHYYLYNLSYNSSALVAIYCTLKNAWVLQSVVMGPLFLDVL